ncbi:Transposon Tn7 transposition protein TnsB [Pseudoalteromonas sp. CIP111854]|uniref:Transposon Tn7 transposition protein TnsB n=1 Tax=Pseudoalteromonas holothuriae TaxID=2963714 RepID=A0A9W4QW89_9GAMM|nr:transposase [Pseudoalteromonas sp. CIP111854]CAH9055561.1 Transposon Tn7 transposition protein TnsB [Pseudoalteromonas sp. CIP111854]
MEIVNNSTWDIQDTEGISDGLYRVLKIYEEISCFIIFNLGKEEGLSRPIAINLDRFNKGIKRNLIKESQFSLPPHMLCNEEEIDKNHLSIRDENYQLIEGIVNNNGFLFDYATKSRVPTLANFAREKGKDRKTIARLLNTYWRNGQDKNALLPAYQNSGGAGKQRQITNQPSGAGKTTRTLAIKRSKTFIVTDSDKENIRKALKKHHLKPHGKNLVETRKELLRTYYSDEVKRAEALNESPYVPSYKQIRSWKNKLFSKDEITKKSTNERDYLLNKRGLLGSAKDKWPVPGSCYEIDATVADVHIVSSFGKQYVLGRPTIYTLVDRASAMIVGLNVSLYHASWRAARQALANAFLPKSSYCKEFDIDIQDSDWPPAHISLRLMCDNGEMIGLEPQKLVVPLTELQLSPPYRPDFKAMVERRFGLLNNEVIHDLLGTTRGGKVVRGDRNPKKDATYTLKEFTTLLIEAVLELNRSIYKSLATTGPLLIEKNLSPTPLNFWKVHVAEHKHALKLADSSDVISRLYPPAKASMTRDGIEYNGMYYSCERVIRDSLASEARTNGRWQLDARINENTTNYIYVRFDKNEDFTKCNLLPKSNMLKDRPMQESEFVMDWIDESNEKSPITVESIDNKEARVNIEKKAKSRAKKDELSATEKMKNTREHRKAEIEATANKVEKNSEPAHQDKSRSNTNSSPSKVTYLPRRRPR